MRLRWKRITHRDDGVSTPASKYHDGRIIYAVVRPIYGRSRRLAEEWYFVAGVYGLIPTVDTIDAPVPTESEAKKMAERYVEKHLKVIAENTIH